MNINVVVETASTKQEDYRRNLLSTVMEAAWLLGHVFLAIVKVCILVLCK